MCSLLRVVVRHSLGSGRWLCVRVMVLQSTENIDSFCQAVFSGLEMSKKKVGMPYHQSPVLTGSQLQFESTN